MELIPYKTAKKEAEAEIIIKKSVFIGHVKPVSDENEALDFLGRIRKKHCDASHNVYAYIIRDNSIFRFSDDGEPSSTAGMPVLSVLQKSGVTNICAVVTRYFGGILLGAGGLVRAYTEAAAAVLTAAGSAIYESFTEFTLTCGYQDVDKVNRYNKTEGITAANIDYAENVTLRLSIKSALYEDYMRKIADLTDGRALFVFTANIYGTA